MEPRKSFGAHVGCALHLPSLRHKLLDTEQWLAEQDGRCLRVQYANSTNNWVIWDTGYLLAQGHKQNSINNDLAGLVDVLRRLGYDVRPDVLQNSQRNRRAGR